MPPPTDWLDFWKTRDITSDRDTVWRLNMQFFVEATEALMDYGPDDVVLDIGCGAGYLPELLHERVREFCGVDISTRYLDHCARKFEGVADCHFQKLDEIDYTSLDFLPERRFTKIICLSVVQYYRDDTDLPELVRAIERVAAPGALCLIADIPTSGATRADAFSLLRIAFRTRRLIPTLRYLFQMRRSEYHDVRASQGVRVYSIEDLDRIAADLRLDAQILTHQLTVNKTRIHWLIRF